MRRHSRAIARALVFIIAALATTVPPLRAQEPAARAGIVTGRAVNLRTRTPIAAAQVTIDGLAARTTTDADGRFRLAELPPGVYTLRVAAIGYRPAVEANVVVSTGKPATLEVALGEAPQQLEEVVAAPSFFIAPEDAPTSTQTLGAEDVRRSPGAQEDVVRAVSLLPGVGITSGGRNDLIVRGGAPSENLFLVDNLEVPNINHFGTQGSSGGPVSLINIDLVRQADFSAGGFGTRYGDRTGSVTAIALRDGNPERVAGQLNLSATGFGGIVEGPLGRNGTFFASVRRSYLDLVFSLVGFNFRPRYWDTNLKLSEQLTRRDRLSWIFVGALDNLSFNNETADNRFDNSRIISQRQDQYFSALTWTHSGERSLVQVTAGRTFARSGTFQDDSALVRIFSNGSTEGENSLRADLSFRPSAATTVNVGSIAKYADRLRYTADIPGAQRRDAAGTPQPLSVDTSFTAFRSGTYAELVQQVAPTARITLGTRADYYGYLASSWRAAPRVALSVGVGHATTLNASAGRYWQSPSFIWLTGDAGNPARLRPFAVDQAVLGVQRLVREDLKVQVEAYYKRYRDYPARIFRPQAVLAPAGFDDAKNDIPFGLEPLTPLGRGRSYGAELFVQKKLSLIPVYGLFSLSLNRSEFTGLDGIERPGAFDTRVIATAAVGWRPNARWELGGRLRVATGAPTTPFVTSGPLAGTLDFSRYNAGPRLPVFHALDIRIDRRWSYRALQLTTYLDVQNVYNRKNASNYYWDERQQAAVLDTGLGALPSIGVNVAF